MKFRKTVSKINVFRTASRRKVGVQNQEAEEIPTFLGNEMCAKVLGLGQKPNRSNVKDDELFSQYSRKRPRAILYNYVLASLVWSVLVKHPHFKT